MRSETEILPDGRTLYHGYCSICEQPVYEHTEDDFKDILKNVEEHLKVCPALEKHKQKLKEMKEKEAKEPEFHYDFHDEKGLTARGEEKLGFKTTNQIFQESMKLSEIAWKEKGEKLKEYQGWLNKKWRPVEV